jgi:hypothetical protein
MGVKSGRGQKGASQSRTSVAYREKPEKNRKNRKNGKNQKKTEKTGKTGKNRKNRENPKKPLFTHTLSQFLNNVKLK